MMLERSGLVLEPHEIPLQPSNVIVDNGSELPALYQAIHRFDRQPKGGYGRFAVESSVKLLNEGYEDIRPFFEGNAITVLSPEWFNQVTELDLRPGGWARAIFHAVEKERDMDGHWNYFASVTFQEGPTRRCRVRIDGNIFLNGT